MEAREPKWREVHADEISALVGRSIFLVIPGKRCFFVTNERFPKGLLGKKRLSHVLNEFEVWGTREGIPTHVNKGNCLYQKSGREHESK
jgi:hypothetical protein